MPLVRRSDHAGVATLTLNRPEKLNALTPQLVVELREHLGEIAVDDAVGCLVLRGAGRSFCAGLDIGGVGQESTPARRRAGAELVDLLESLPQPSIAAIHGYCFTGGLELALGCDLLVATESATIGDTHARLGLVPVWGMSVRLPERVGRARAKRILLTSERLDARTAQQIGLLDSCWPDAEFDAELDRLTGAICGNSWGSNRRIKRLLGLPADERSLRLALERTRPWGLPDDAAALPNPPHPTTTPGR